jgi:hypothetical protein
VILVTVIEINSLPRRPAEFYLARIALALVTTVTEQAVGSAHSPRIEEENGPWRDWQPARTILRCSLI